MNILAALRARGMSGEDAVMGILRGLRPVTSFGDVEAVDAVDGLSVGRNPLPNILNSIGLARVVAKGPKGEDDFDDARYWTQLVTPAAGSAGAQPTLLGAAGVDPDIRMGTNLLEQPIGSTGGTHTLPKGTPIWLFSTPDADGVDRLVFFAPIHNPLIVYVSIDSAADTEGSPTTTCTLTYTVEDENGTELGTTMVPEAPDRYANCEYLQVADESPAIGYYDAGTFKLLMVPGEIPKGDVITIQEQRLNGLDIETRTKDKILVLEAGEWSEWSVLDEGTECDGA